MLSALFSFLGGSAFRMIWGEVAAFVNRRQEHAQELDRMRLQADLEASRHDRDMARIKLQSDLGVKEVQIAGDIALAKAEADAFVEAMRNANKPTGVAWVDAWNGSIRPAAATIALTLWFLKLASQGFVMEQYDQEITGVVLGFFFADRSLSKRAK